jgi:flavin-dependent dehydrogenase
VWLAGDAVGHVHPLSGVGITLGVLDAEALASAGNLADYRRARSANVAELLASVLYLAFSRKDASATRIRHGLLRMLRKSASERRRTMRLLMGEDRNGASFADAFLRATGQVVATGAQRSATRRHSWTDWARQLGQDAAWLEWPIRAVAPAADGFLLNDRSRFGAGLSQSLTRTFKNRSALS